MKLITKNTDYAIRAIIQVAMNDKEYISAAEISRNEKIPYQYLRKIIAELIKEKIFSSKEGTTGGVKLIKDKKKIMLVDLMNIFQGDVQLSECIFRNKFCHKRATCVLRKNIERIEKNVIKEFSGITIASLIKEMGGKE
ncbi:MAG: Rrf2 family transcriptional regulator [Candidatus Omnitrophica bacterium]|nr:Rrf2 family transcriptional regulator [Candidatus Omnitrophota bacterium]